MAITNHERIGKSLELLSHGLQPFVERELRTRLGNKWDESAKNISPDGKPNWADPHLVLSVMWDQWNTVFKDILGHAERSFVSELRDVRNKWAHQERLSTDDVYRALDSIVRLLTAVSAPEADEVERQKQELLRIRFDEQARHEKKKSAATPIDGQPMTGLRPWREVVTPHPDVASGHYQQAEFAADLWQVYCNEGAVEYKDPIEFFRRTFITDGLRQLLVWGVQRLSANSGVPVVELQTNFGGGKTHSMLALYHLFAGKPTTEFSGIESVLTEAGVSLPKNVKRAVLVGTKIAPGQPHKKPDGTVVKTLWGELAWQLGGKEGYELVRQADETSTNPGDVLKDLFNKYSPCLILIDEWVAYARQLYHVSTLPAGTFDSHFTFAQLLSESAKNAKNTFLVLSLPSSDNEIGGEGGKAALERLKNAVGRVESSWRPASAEEGFEIVRRRLFQPMTSQETFVVRDTVAKSYSEMYRTQAQEFPSEAKEADYERRLKSAYPIHPELFDRLFNDWSSLDKFQRTRGVLRLMASVIHSLWEREDKSVIIMPASIPIDDPTVQFELTRYLEDQWVPVIEKDVDGPNSLPLQLDRNNPNLGRYSACRRVARTVYLGSAPTLGAAHRGIDDLRIKLGCVQPGESVATFGDALRRLTDRASYLYVDGRRYWYNTQPSVSRLADDRSTQFSQDEVSSEIHKRLRDDSNNRGDFVKVHPFPASGADVPDETECRLVILDSNFAHAAKDKNSSALQEAKSILDKRGSGNRRYKNTLVFLAADKTRQPELEQSVRQYLAWTSILGDHETLNLDAFQKRQAYTKKETADETVKARLPEAFQWLLLPTQPDPKQPIEWQELRLQGIDPLAVRASKKLKNEGLLNVVLAGTLLRMELDKIPLWRGNHVSIKQLFEDFAQYIYLPRVKDSSTIVKSISDGLSLITWQTETFAYAESWDEEKNQYRGLRSGTHISTEDSSGLIVKPYVAAIQMQKTIPPTSSPTELGIETKPISASTSEIPITEQTSPTRFHGSVLLDPTRLARDAGQIATEVVQHLVGIVGADVTVTLEIHAKMPKGTSESIVRTVTENCRTLKFDSHGFEKE